MRGKQTPARTFLFLPIVLQKKKILPILYQQIEDKAGLIALDELIPGLCQILARAVQFLDQQTGNIDSSVKPARQDWGRTIVVIGSPGPLIFTPNFPLSPVLTQHCHPVIQVIKEPLLH